MSFSFSLHRVRPVCPLYLSSLQPKEIDTHTVCCLFVKFPSLSFRRLYLRHMSPLCPALLKQTCLGKMNSESKMWQTLFIQEKGLCWSAAHFLENLWNGNLCSRKRPIRKDIVRNATCALGQIKALIMRMYITIKSITSVHRVVFASAQCCFAIENRNM